MKKNITSFLFIIVFIIASLHLSAQTSAQLINLGFGGAAKISNNGLICLRQ